MFTIHRSERSDALVDALIEIVRSPLDDPFSAEIVAVPTRGVERWLTHRIANSVGTSPGRGDGVCAHVEFPYPGRLVGDVLATATGVERETDPWRVERLVWPLLQVIDDNIESAWLSTLAQHLVGDDEFTESRKRRRFSTARHLAELFDTYSTYRPEMVLGWLDDNIAEIPDDARWQATLWQQLRQHVGLPSPAERVDEACVRVRSGEVELDLPARISLFGLTRLPATYLEVLRAVATQIDVHAFALHPSMALWDKVAATAVPELPLARSDDPTTDVAQHPLLRTWAHDTREMQLAMAAADAEDLYHPVVAPEPTTLLAHLQHAVRSDVAPPGAPHGDIEGEPDDRVVIADDDTSVQVHACHGRARQVEVVRDAICHALADDPTLEPRDIVVMCPDIDEFAPLLQATFGMPDPDPDGARRMRSIRQATRPASASLIADGAVDRGVPALPYRLADRSLRQTNPLLATLDALLELVEGRITAPDLVAFLGRTPVRHRFSFSDDDLSLIASWVADANVRWGLDAEHRSGYSLGEVDANTWLTGIDRVVLGIAITADGDPIVGGRTPLDDVESGDVDCAGRLSEAVDRIRHAARDAAEPAPIDRWAQRLTHAADALMSTSFADAWQRSTVDAMLREVVDGSVCSGGPRRLTDASHPSGSGSVASDPSGPELSLSEVRDLLAHRLRGAPTRSDFRTGAITMCTLVPMRAVPHRVVCVLGLDDGTFPRTGGGDGDDLLRRLPLVGDRDPRWEDRQLLLDALMSATEKFIVTSTGRDPRTNEERPPAVPLAELLDVCDRTARTADGRSASETVRVEHPLQAFDPIEFDATRRPGGRPWAFDTIALAGARASQGPTTEPPRLADLVLAPVSAPGGVLELSELIRFVQHPIREFLRQRLGLNTWDGDDALSDNLPLELDDLEQWAVGDRILTSLLAGASVDDAQAAERSRGALPPGALGDGFLAKARQRAEAVAKVATDNGVADSRHSIGVSIDPTGGTPARAQHSGVTAVVGSVTGVGEATTLSVAFSSVGPRHKLEAWVRLLALTANDPSVAWKAVHVGRYGGRGETWSIGPLGETSAERDEIATRYLGELVELWSIGMCSALPMPAKTGHAWVETSRLGRPAFGAAAEEWKTNNPEYDKFKSEDLDSSHVRIFGGQLSLQDLLAIPATDAEVGPGWHDDPSRFVRLTHRLWDPIFETGERR